MPASDSKAPAKSVDGEKGAVNTAASGATDAAGDVGAGRQLEAAVQQVVGPSTLNMVVNFAVCCFLSVALVVICFMLLRAFSFPTESERLVARRLGARVVLSSKTQYELGRALRFWRKSARSAAGYVVLVAFGDVMNTAFGRLLIVAVIFFSLWRFCNRRLIDHSFIFLAPACLLVLGAVVPTVAPDICVFLAKTDELNASLAGGVLKI